ncbi:hypothetical protein Sste5346_008761 [Sporothrix stenoceras]|uniref:Uncharacterized protein n=1 Tax=Sporothrix stenoceras TaxID=5173 RepID=A0ABR3YP47_9PEZI
MVNAISGYWHNYAEPRVLDETVTLSLKYSGYLISGLTLAVTLAGSSFWSVLAFFLHSWRARRGDTATILDLQYQASLQNTASATSTLGDAGKTMVAWRGKGVRRLFGRTLGFSLPPLLAWAGFTVAGIFVSNVANKDYSSSVVRVAPDNCGFVIPDTTDTTSFAAAAAWGTKVLNDTIQGRNYMSDFYQNQTTSPIVSQSLFVQPKLPYTPNIAAACPIPAVDMCIPGHNGALSLTTPELDSQLMFGINAKREDRVTVTLSTTCSPLDHTGFVNVVDDVDGGLTATLYNLGPLTNVSDFTYSYIDQTINTSTAYMMDSAYSFGKNPEASVWQPIDELARDDADMTILFFSQNSVTYFGPVFDPFFLANGSRTEPLTATQLLYKPNSYVNTMICADQYTLCNPNSNTCTPAGGLKTLQQDVLVANTPGFNATQYATAKRIIDSIARAGTYNSVNGLGAAALFATNLLSQRVSVALPDNQWQTEVEGWFGTTLAKIQASLVSYAVNGDDLGPYIYVDSPYSALSSAQNPTQFDIAVNQAFQDQCRGQLVQITGAVQNFSFLGIMIIAGVSVFLVLAGLLLGLIVDKVSKAGPAATARQTDDKFHLQRMALGEPSTPNNVWQNRTFGVPVLEQGGEMFQRPEIIDGQGDARLVSYPKSARLSPMGAGSDGTSLGGVSGGGVGGGNVVNGMNVGGVNGGNGRRVQGAGH